MHFRLVIICIAVLTVATSASARPVSYPGGWTGMQINDVDAHRLHIHYSPTARYSVGYKAEYWRDKHWQFHGAQLNYLAKRWNAPASQANFYIKTGAGIAQSDYRTLTNELEAAGFAGIALDWEDRRYFTSYENRVTYAGDIDRSFMQKARVGVAPYVGDYGDLHTWLMLQVDHNPKSKDEIVLTPLVRFFKGEYLAEAGISDKGDVLANWIIRF